MDSITKAKALHGQGKSYRQIAQELKVSKSTVALWVKSKPAQPVEKSWLNPKWTSPQDNQDSGPVDLYGAIAAPKPEDLLRSFEDTIFVCTDWVAKSVAKNHLKILVKTYPGQTNPKALTIPARLHTKSLQLVQKVADVREVVDHLSVDLLNHPNHEQSKYDFLYYIDSQLSLCGEAYVFKQKESYHRLTDINYINEGLPVALWPLMTQYVTQQAEKGKIVGYTYNLTQPPQFFKREDLIHFKFINPSNPYTQGYGPVRAVYERVLLQKNELAYLLSLFRNQARPDAIVSFKGGATADQCERYQKELSQRFRQGGIGGPWVTDGEDVEVKNLSWAPKDMLGTELYKYTKSQIIAAFSLNDALFTTESSNRAVATEAERSAQKRAIEPRLRCIEEKINHELLPEFDERLVAEFDNPVEADEDFDLDRNTKYVDRLTPLQTAVYTNTMPRQAAIETAAVLMGISNDEAAKFFPLVEAR